ncbi:MAG: hypothetical protein K6T86_19315 [Pirellulales bacterium]|nr:hypothetical protein [Pirellulales bacterium]
MTKRINRVTVVEVSDSAESARPVVRDVLPWADPYIARLLAQHRLEAALADSLEHLEAERARQPHWVERPLREVF